MTFTCSFPYFWLKITSSFPYFWLKSFIVEYSNEVLPIEIKSGKPDELKIYNHTALNNLINMYSIDKAFVFGECNVVKETSVITQFPIYMISFIKK